MTLRPITTFAASILFAAALAGCGSGGGGTVTPLAAQAQSGQRVPGSIVIRIPSASQASSAAMRRVSYVSAASFSTKIAITGAQGCTQCSPPVTLEVSLAGFPAPCVTSGGVKTCTVALNLLPGSYVGTIRIYDGVLDGQGHVTGKPLSENTSFPIAIASGQSNAVPVTLDGVPTSIQTTVLTPATVTVDQFAATPIYRLTSAGATAQLSVVAKDADGAVIAGPGAPVFTVASSIGFSAVLSGNTITLTAPAKASRQAGSVAISSTSPGCSEPIAVCSLALNLGFVELAAIADFTHVTVWPIGGTAPLVTLTTGISTPSAVAFASDGTLFVGNTGNDTVTVYAPPYTAPPTVISIGIHKPVALVLGAANNLIVANALGSTTLYPPPYKTATPLVFLDGGTPADVRVDPIGRLWTVNQLGFLRRFSPPYTPSAPDFVISGAFFNKPVALALDSSGLPYVADAGKYQVMRFNLPLSSASTPGLTISSTATEPINQPNSLAVAPDGTIFVSNVGNAGVVDIYSSTGAELGGQGGLPAVAAPGLFAIDSGNTVWFATAGGAPIAFAAPYNVSPPLHTLNPTGFLAPNAIAIYP
jgi:sugar lactone lactonase YvrE